MFSKVVFAVSVEAKPYFAGGEQIFGASSSILLSRASGSSADQKQQ